MKHEKIVNPQDCFLFAMQGENSNAEKATWKLHDPGLLPQTVNVPVEVIYELFAEFNLPELLMKVPLYRTKTPLRATPTCFR